MKVCDGVPRSSGAGTHCKTNVGLPVRGSVVDAVTARDYSVNQAGQ